MKKILLTIILLVFIAIPDIYGSDKIVIRVFHAGSLTVPFQKMKEEFEKRNPGIEVRLEPSGSVLAVRKVTDLKKPGDVVAVADHTLIKKMLFPEYTDRYYIFGGNEIVLTYTDKSRGSREITPENWYRILQLPGVKWGFSNPDLDPCGYRTLMVLALADSYYGERVYDALITPYLNIPLTGKTITVPEEIRIVRGGKVFVRPKSVELLGMLETGFLDYAFEYRSVALQHHLRYVRLPEAINLSSLKYRKEYGRISVRLSNGKTIKGKPILYGITVIKSSPHRVAAEKWVRFVTGREGARIMQESYQKSIYPPILVRDEEQ